MDIFVPCGTYQKICNLITLIQEWVLLLRLPPRCIGALHWVEVSKSRIYILEHLNHLDRALWIIYTVKPSHESYQGFCGRTCLSGLLRENLFITKWDLSLSIEPDRARLARTQTDGLGIWEGFCFVFIHCRTSTNLKSGKGYLKSKAPVLRYCWPTATEWALRTWCRGSWEFTFTR